MGATCHNYQIPGDIFCSLVLQHAAAGLRKFMEPFDATLEYLIDIH